MSAVADLAEGVKEALNAPVDPFSINFVAERRYVPAIDLGTIGAKLSVIVFAKSDARELLDRSGDELRQVQIDIGVQKKLSAGINPEASSANAEIDALMTLVEEIAAYLKPTTVIGDRAIILQTAVDPIYATEHLVAHSVFTSVVTVTLKLVPSE